MNERFLPHLEDLRERLLKSIAAFAASTFVALIFAKDIIKFLERPLLTCLPAGATLVYTGVADKFLLMLKAAFLAGSVVSVPYVLWQLRLFLQPSLKPADRLMLTWIFVLSAVLFGGGMALAFFLVLPSTVSFLLDFGGDIASPMLTLKDYLDFEIGFLLVTGILFQTPLVMFLLIQLRVLDGRAIGARRAEVFAGLAIVCALVTPSQDAVTMLSVLLPLYGLFEIGLLISKKITRNAR